MYAIIETGGKQYKVQAGDVVFIEKLDVEPVTCSDSDGYIYDPDGIDREKLDYIMELKNVERSRFGVC